jgi:hypothetical protein
MWYGDNYAIQPHIKQFIPTTHIKTTIKVVVVDVKPWSHQVNAKQCGRWVPTFGNKLPPRPSRYSGALHIEVATNITTSNLRPIMPTGVRTSHFTLMYVLLFYGSGNLDRCKQSRIATCTRRQSFRLMLWPQTEAGVRCHRDIFSSF